MTQSADTKSTSQHRLWRESEPPFVNLQVVFWLILMTPSIVSLAVIWLLANMSLKGQALVSTQVGSGVSTLKSGVEKFNTRVLFPSLKSSRQLFGAVLKTVSEEDRQHCPLSYLASGNPRHPRAQKQQRNRRQQSRKLDYSIQLSALFYQRFIEMKNISLFSPHDVPGLYDAFGTESFDELYERYERKQRFRNECCCPRTHSKPT